MFRDVDHLRRPDPYYSGAAGFIGRTLEQSGHERAGAAAGCSRERSPSPRWPNAYIYSYYSYDLLTLAAPQTFPCLELDVIFQEVVHSV